MNEPFCTSTKEAIETFLPCSSPHDTQSCTSPIPNEGTTTTILALHPLPLCILFTHLRATDSHFLPTRFAKFDTPPPMLAPIQDETLGGMWGGVMVGLHIFISLTRCQSISIIQGLDIEL